MLVLQPVLLSGENILKAHGKKFQIFKNITCMVCMKPKHTQRSGNSTTSRLGTLKDWMKVSSNLYRFNACHPNIRPPLKCRLR